MASEPDTPDQQPQPTALVLKPWQFHLLTGIGAIAVVLVVITTTLATSVTGIRRQLEDRQDFINETLLLSRLNVQLAQILANLAVATSDRELEALLADNGITFDSQPADAANRAALSPGAAATLESEEDRR
jgi:hypothetical protein